MENLSGNGTRVNGEEVEALCDVELPFTLEMADALVRIWREDGDIILDVLEMGSDSTEPLPRVTLLPREDL